MSDVRWWLRQLNGATEAVLILKVDHNIPKVILEKWIRDGNGRSHRETSITARKGANNTINIDNGPLIIGFEQIILRSPTTPKETDVVFSDEELREIATCVWIEQDFWDCE